MDSDDELQGLALAALQRDLEDTNRRLRELTGTVAEIGARVLYGPVPNQVWRWEDFDENETAAALAELREWMRKTLTRYPTIFDRLRPCWPEHSHAVEALSAAYGTWLLAHHGKANFEQKNYFIDRWLPSLKQQLEISLRECRGAHRPDEVDIAKLG